MTTRCNFFTTSTSKLKKCFFLWTNLMLQHSFILYHIYLKVSKRWLFSKNKLNKSLDEKKKVSANIPSWLLFAAFALYCWLVGIVRRNINNGTFGVLVMYLFPLRTRRLKRTKNCAFFHSLFFCVCKQIANNIYDPTKTLIFKRKFVDKKGNIFWTKCLSRKGMAMATDFVFLQ